jgi:hypothetical protein
MYVINVINEIVGGICCVCVCVCVCRLFELLVCVCVDCLNCDVSRHVRAEIVVLKCRI